MCLGTALLSWPFREASWPMPGLRETHAAEAFRSASSSMCSFLDHPSLRAMDYSELGTFVSYL